MYNDIVNGSLPVSVLQIPTLFNLPDKYFPWWRNGEPHEEFPYSYPDDDKYLGFEMVRFLNISIEAWRNYHYLWYTYYNDNTNFTLVCQHDSDSDSIYAYGCNCSADPLCFEFPSVPVESYRNDNDFTLLEGDSTSPPCSNYATIENFKIKSICSLLSKISMNKDSFLKLMMFTKQSPSFYDDLEQCFSCVTKYGFTPIYNSSKMVIFLLYIYS